MCAPGMGNPLVDLAAALFGLDDVPALTVAPLGDATMTVMHLAGADAGGDGREVALPPIDAYLLQLYLADVRHCDVLPEGRETPVRLYPRGSLCLVDLSAGMTIRIEGGYDILAFHVPHALIAEQVAASQVPPVRGLVTCRAAEDPVVRHLGGALLPLFGGIAPAPSETLGFLASGLAAHLVHRYARVTSDSVEDLARFLRQGIARGVGLDTLAGTLRFLPPGFAEAFAVGVGAEPLPWLRREAVEQAKGLLATGERSITEIARACGFSDGGELRRHFVALAGMSPSAWRRRGGA